MTARLLIVGPQGSGKCTQGIRIADAFGVPAISTGDMFRAAVASGSAVAGPDGAAVSAGAAASPSTVAPAPVPPVMAIG